MAEQFYVLWVNRNGQHLWEGPFAVEGVAWGQLTLITFSRPSGAGEGFVLRGTQMSNRPAQLTSALSQPMSPAGGFRVPAPPPLDDFRTARPARLPRGNPAYGPWIVATYDSDCDGDCGGEIMKGDDIRADGQGGWLCPQCGEKTQP